MKPKKNKNSILYVVQFKVDKMHTIVEEYQIIERSFFPEAEKTLDDVPIGTTVHVKDKDKIYEAVIKDVDFKDKRPRLVQVCESMIRAANSKQRCSKEVLPRPLSSRPTRVQQKNIRYDDESSDDMTESERKQEAAENVAAVRKSENQLKKAADKMKLKELQQMHVQRGREFGQLITLKKMEERNFFKKDSESCSNRHKSHSSKREATSNSYSKSSSSKKLKTAVSEEASLTSNKELDDMTNNVPLQKPIQVLPIMPNAENSEIKTISNNNASAQISSILQIGSTENVHCDIISNQSIISSLSSDIYNTQISLQQTIDELKKQIFVLNNEKQVVIDERDLAFVERNDLARELSDLKLRFHELKENFLKSDAHSIELLESIVSVLKDRAMEAMMEEQFQVLDNLFEKKDVTTPKSRFTKEGDCVSTVAEDINSSRSSPEPSSSTLSAALPSDKDSENLVLGKPSCQEQDLEWAYDEDQQLLHERLQDGLCLLHNDHPTIFVNIVLRERAKRRSKSMSDCLRTLTPGIFKAEALKVCSCKGTDRGRRGKDPVRRPGLNSEALQAICKFTMEVGETKGFANNTEVYFYKQVSKYLQDKH